MASRVADSWPPTSRVSGASPQTPGLQCCRLTASRPLARRVARLRGLMASTAEDASPQIRGLPCCESHGLSQPARRGMRLPAPVLPDSRVPALRGERRVSAGSRLPALQSNGLPPPRGERGVSAGSWPLVLQAHGLPRRSGAMRLADSRLPGYRLMAPGPCASDVPPTLMAPALQTHGLPPARGAVRLRGLVGSCAAEA
jgi:hypothetical protein